MPVRTIRGDAVYNPSCPRSGSEGDFIFRMSNLIKRGKPPQNYWEATGGPLNLSESVAATALAGTVALAANSATVTGTGTAFLTELHLGQFFLVIDTVGHQSFLGVVKRIVSNTSVIVHAPATITVSGKTAYRMPVIFAVDNQRGTALRGVVRRFDNGTLFSVGDGEFKLDGAALGGSTLNLTRQPKVSLRNVTTGNYTHFSLGLPTPVAPTGTAVAGGTKGMQAAEYSFVVTAERIETIGYGNPSLVESVTIAAGQRIQLDFGAMDGTSGQNGWGVWGTRYVDAQDTQGKNYLNGPWFRVMAGSGPNGMVIAADLTGTAVTFEYLDAEVEGNDQITFNNFGPPDAEFVELFNAVPVYISCQGLGDTSPGPRIFPGKPSNIEAAPPDVAYPTSPPEIILGSILANGRVYLLTTGHLQVATGTPDDRLPTIIKPFWKAGFSNPYQLVSIDGMLYGCTTAGPTRSISDGDEQDVADTWAGYLNEYINDWVMGHILVEHDPSNDTVCFFHPAWSLNSSGFWTTRVWGWGLTQQEWIFDFLLTSTTGDMIVSGVARIGPNLEFLCGGRQAGDTMAVGTYRFDQGASSTAWFVAPSYTDDGSELRSKKVGRLRATGKLTSSTLKVYGAKPGEVVNVADLEAGTNAKSTANLANSPDVTQYAQVKRNVKNLGIHTVRLAGTYSGSGVKDRIEEIVYETEIGGVRN